MMHYTLKYTLWTYVLNHVVYEFPKVLSFNIGIW